MASLKCHNCADGIHSNDVPNDIEREWYPLSAWDELAKANRPIYEIDDDHDFYSVWRCGRCGCVHLLKNYECRVERVYAPEIKARAISKEKPNYILFDDVNLDGVFEDELIPTDLAKSKYYWEYAAVTRDRIDVFADREGTKHLRSYRALGGPETDVPTHLDSGDVPVDDFFSIEIAEENIDQERQTVFLRPSARLRADLSVQGRHLEIKVFRTLNHEYIADLILASFAQIRAERFRYPPETWRPGALVLLAGWNWSATTEEILDAARKGLAIAPGVEEGDSVEVRVRGATYHIPYSLKGKIKMASLKCSLCGNGIHYHDLPDGTEHFWFPLSSWDEFSLTDRPAVLYKTQNFGAFYTAWKCGKCGCVHLFERYEAKVTRAYAPSASEPSAVPGAKPNYILFDDVNFDALSEEEMTPKEIATSQYHWEYAVITRDRIDVFADREGETPLRSYRAIPIATVEETGYLDSGGRPVDDYYSVAVAEKYIAQERRTVFLQPSARLRADLSVQGRHLEIKVFRTLNHEYIADLILASFAQIRAERFRYPPETWRPGALILLAAWNWSATTEEILDAARKGLAFAPGVEEGDSVEVRVRGTTYKIR